MTIDILEYVKDCTVKGRVNLMFFDIKTERKFTDIIQECVSNYMAIEKKLDELIKINRELSIR